MLLLRAPAPFAYAKVDKIDAEEARHRKAQFLIHKVLEESGRATTAARRRPAAALARGACRVKARIGVRLKRFRLAVRRARLRVYRTLQRHLRNLRLVPE